MATNTGMSVMILIMAAALFMQVVGRDLCEQTVPVGERISFMTRSCVYNGCFGCYSTHVSDELDQDCRDYYKNVNNVWQSYKCCIYTPDQCPKVKGPHYRDNPLKRYLDTASRQQQYED